MNMKLLDFIAKRQQRRYLAVKLAQKLNNPPLVVHFSSLLLMTPPENKKTSKVLEFQKTGRALEVPMDHHILKAWSWGEGPLVLLVHGWGGYGAQLKSFVNPLVEKGHQVVCFDAYGHGESDGKVSSVVHISRSIKAVLDFLERSPKAAIAHSMGTSALLLNMAHYMTPVENLTLISAPYEGPIAHSKKFAKVVGISEDQRLGVQKQIEWRLDHPWVELEISLLLKDMEGRKLLLIHDIKDRVAPSSHLDSILKHVPDARVLRTQGSGHFKILSHEEVIKSVFDHISF